MRAVIYARVSSEEQADRGLSVPTQVKICREFIKRNGWVYVREYIDEGISGLKAYNRPSFIEMLSDAQERKFDLIVVYSLSRFSRNRFDAITKKKLLRDVGVEVISATEPIDIETPEGKLLEGVIESINEFYSANLSREAFRGLKANAEMGFWNGGTPPLGYRKKRVIVNGVKKSTYEIDEKEALIVKKIFNLAYSGLGMKKTCAVLNSEGFRTRRGKIFTPSTVRGILLNEAYIGNLVWNKQDKKTKGKKYKDKKEWIRRENVFPKIIDREIFYAIQKRFERNRMNHSPKSVARPHILSGLLKCGLCGSNYIFQNTAKKRGEKVYSNRYYKCALKQKMGSKYCDNVVLKAEPIEKKIISILLKKIYSEKNIKKVFEIYKKEKIKEKKEEEKDKNLLEAQLKKVRKRINNILKAVEKGFRSDALKERLDALKKREESLVLELSKKNSVEFNYSYAEIKSFSEMMQNVIPHLEAVKLNKILKLFIKKIVVYPDSCIVFYTFNFDNSILGSKSSDFLKNPSPVKIKIEGINTPSFISNENICRGYNWCREG